MAQEAQQQAPQQAQQEQGGREGARWINRPPEPNEFANWFVENTPKHDESIDLAKYVGGITIIPAEEKYKAVVGFNQGSGDPVIVDRKRMVYVPYPKVEARLSYFWDLMELRGDRWHGVIEPVESPGAREEGTGAIATINRTLPPGFFIMPIPVGEGYSHFIVCSMRVAIYERPINFRVDENGKRVIDKLPIIEGRGTKMVAITKSNFQKTSFWPDDVSIMKAETGAIGRCLGMAGMLAVPGSGVATAEDMIEALTATPTATQTTEPQEPSSPSLPPARQGPGQPAQDAAPQTGAEQADDEHAIMIARARELIGTLTEDHPEKLEEFRRWANERKPPLRNIGGLKGGALRGTIKRLEKLLQEATEAQQGPVESEPEPEATPEGATAEGATAEGATAEGATAEEGGGDVG